MNTDMGDLSWHIRFLFRLDLRDGEEFQDYQVNNTQKTLFVIFILLLGLGTTWLWLV